MNCKELRELLPALVYEDLSAETRAEANAHLARCAACREEHEALAEVRHLLDGAPTPRVHVDVPKIMAEANRLDLRQARRWRRVAVLALAAAAALLVVLGLRLEVRLEERQLSVRWGGPEVQQAQPVAVVQEQPVSARAEVTAADMRLVKDLLHGLVTAVEEQDNRFEQNLARLESQLNEVRADARTRWSATERYVSALQSSQLASRPKGE